MLAFGLVGERLSHSLSVPIHTMIFEETGRQADYQLYEIERDCAHSLCRYLADRGLSGFNVTIPYKETVLSQLDELSPAAKRIGAVNTVRIDKVNDRFWGDNTDYAGFRRMLDEQNVDVAGGTAVILGTGGAQKAVSAVLWDEGAAQVFAVTRRPEHSGIAMPDDTMVVGYDALSSLSGRLLVNATPVGTAPQPDCSPVDDTVVAQFDALADLVYNPAQTAFMRQGLLAGKPVLGGMTMLIGQAIAAQERWFGTAYDGRLFEIVRRRMTLWMKESGGRQP